MTTIAFKDGVVAYDSLATAGSLITSRDCNKKMVQDGVVFFIAGAVSDFDALVACWFGFKPEPGETIDTTAIVVEDGSVYLCSHDKDDGFWKQPLDKYTCYAIGSGMAHALTAMDMGADAVGAVKMASLRDACTGGKIKKYKIKR